MENVSYSHQRKWEIGLNIHNISINGNNIFNICYNRYLYARTEIGDDNSGYYVFFIGDDTKQNVKEAIRLIENLGLRKIDLGAFNHTMHYFTIDLKQQKN